MTLTKDVRPEDLVHLGTIVQAQTRPSWQVTVIQSNNTALNLTGATFTGVLQNLSRDTRKTVTAVNYSITDAANGIFTYAPAAADVDTQGLWGWQTKITISSQIYIVRLSVLILPDWAD